jgi:uncharacterized HAD superfamily protein
MDLDSPIPYEIPKPKVYLVDIDGTLCKGVCWDDDSILKAEPVKEMIDKVNELHERNFIVIHTARRHERYLATVKWLAKHDVRYHSLRFEKCPGDFIVDADAITKVEDL